MQYPVIQYLWNITVWCWTTGVSRSHPHPQARTHVHTHTHTHTHIFVRIFGNFLWNMNLFAFQMEWNVGSLHYLAKIICRFLLSSLSHRTWLTLGSAFACTIADILLKVCTSQLYNCDLSQVQLVVLSLVLPYQMMMSWCRNPDCVWPVSCCNLLSNPE